MSRSRSAASRYAGSWRLWYPTVSVTFASRQAPTHPPGGSPAGRRGADRPPRRAAPLWGDHHFGGTATAQRGQTRGDVGGADPAAHDRGQRQPPLLDEPYRRGERVGGDVGPEDAEAPLGDRVLLDGRERVRVLTEQHDARAERGVIDCRRELRPNRIDEDLGPEWQELGPSACEVVRRQHVLRPDRGSDATPLVARLDHDHRRSAGGHEQRGEEAAG